MFTKSILFLPYPVLHSVTVEDDINDSCKGLNPSVLFSQSSDVTVHVKMFILSNTTCISICLKVKQIFSVYWLLISVFLICVLICHLLKNVINNSMFETCTWIENDTSISALFTN